MKLEELLERVKPLGKHNIYSDPIGTGLRESFYKEEGFRIILSPNAKWKVCVLKGVERDDRHTIFYTTDKGVGDIVVLRLDDEEHGLLLVESFLTKEEARKLAHNLLKAIGEEVDSDGRV